QYDVFLLQGQGQRRWKISTAADASTAFRDDAELKLLREFTPTHEWLLETGDMLYLPPGVPHHGVAEGNCLTFSIGMRAPATGEMLADFAGSVAEKMSEESRYRDAGIGTARRIGEIDDLALEKIAQALSDSMRVDASTLRGWFGSFITRYRAAHEAQPRPRALSVAAFEKQIDDGVQLMPNPWSRFAWLTEGRAVRLFVAGEEHACTRALAERLCARGAFDATDLAAPGSAMRVLLRDLVNAGHLALFRPRRQQ
ncbi:MAG: cupin domain-containing protein, partial [Dokdonella sp.]